MRTERPLTPATTVYDEASTIYRQGFAPLVAVAGLVAFFLNALLLITPTIPVVYVSWGLLVNFTGVLMLSSALLVPIIMALRPAGGRSYGTPMTGLREHGLHIALATLLLMVANGILVFSILGIALAALLTARLALISVAAAVEDQDVTDSLARSWELTDRCTRRTGMVLLGAAAPMAALLVFLAIVDLPALLVIAAMIVGEALVVPFVVVVLVIMFEEYRALKPEPDDFGPRR